MTQELRPYQRRALVEIRDHWQAGKRAPILVAPTGSGKTTIMAHLIREVRAASGGGAVLFLAPWQQLVYQGHARLREHGIPAGILMGAKKPAADEPVHVASIQTAVRRKLGDYSVIIIDEAHRAVAGKCLELLRKYPKARMLGATATPSRLDGKALDKVFDAMVLTASVDELIRQGFLVRPQVYAPETALDLSGVKYDRKTHDYEARSLSERMNSPRLLGGLTEQWLKYAPFKRTVVFCCSKVHAKAVAAEFEGRNVRSGFIEADTPQSERQKILDDLRAGRIHVVANVNCLTEGFDMDVLQCVVQARPTFSLVLHLQQIGRGMRPADGKSFLTVLDHADNVRRHGFADQARVWNLKGHEGAAATRQAIEGAPPKARPCPSCHKMIAANATVCPWCNAPILPTVADGKLRRMTPDSLRANAPALA